jgi:type IV secretion system protein VirD4
MIRACRCVERQGRPAARHRPRPSADRRGPRVRPARRLRLALQHLEPAAHRPLAGNNTLYLVAPLGDDSRIGLVFAALLHDLITDAFTAYNRRGAPLDPRLLIVCDEAANTPLPKLPQWAATVSGAGVQLVTVWQSRAQLDTIYGREADGVLTNHRSKLFYPSGLTDTTTTDYLSLLAGTEHVRGDLAPRHLSGAADADDRARIATAVPYVSADVARRLQVGDALLVHGHLPPTWIPASTRPQ